jgi:hypothetical protein
VRTLNEIDSRNATTVSAVFVRHDLNFNSTGVLLYGHTVKYLLCHVQLVMKMPNTADRVQWRFFPLGDLILDLNRLKPSYFTVRT